MNYESMDREIPVKHDYPFPVPEESLLPQLFTLEIAVENQQIIDKDSEYDLVNIFYLLYQIIIHTYIYFIYLTE